MRDTLLFATYFSNIREENYHLYYTLANCFIKYLCHGNNESL
jgi:hypothetical protein